jgi:hypothetical protein
VALAIALAVVIPGSALAGEPPPSQVSGLVWLDSNKNGVPDPGEPGLPGVAVVVRDGAGQQAGAVRTDAGGRYTATAPAGTFAVCFGLPDVYADYLFTAGNGCVPGAAVVNAGIVAPPNKVAGTVWVDMNKDGLRDDGEPRVAGVTLFILEGTGRVVGRATTGPDGRYEVSNLPDGTFMVCFAVNEVTRPNAGEDDLDSDANPATGCTSPLNLGLGNRENLTVDAGLIPSGGSGSQG